MASIEHPEIPEKTTKAAGDAGRDLEPQLYERNGIVFADSRDVAAFFGKQHLHVLRDIRNLLKNMANPNLDWLIEASYLDDRASSASVMR